MCIKLYELDSAHFLSAPGLAWQVCLKKTGVKLELLNNSDVSLMVEKGIRREICHTILRYAEANYSDKGYVLEIDVEYPKKLHDLHSDLIDKCSKPFCSLYGKKLCCSYKIIKKALNQGLILTKHHGVIQFNQEAWLKPYIDMNTE